MPPIVTLTKPRMQAALEEALARIELEVSQVAERVARGLGQAALTAHSAKQRDICLATQQDLHRKMASFGRTFADAFRQKVQKDLAPSEGSSGTLTHSQWQSLTLVDDKQVEELVSADRLAQTLAEHCEWELRDLDGYVGTVLGLGRPERDRNPLRPEVIAAALFPALQIVGADEDSHKLLTAQFGRELAQSIRDCYREIIAAMRERGIERASMSVKALAPSASGEEAEPTPPAHADDGRSAGEGAVRQSTPLRPAGRPALLDAAAPTRAPAASPRSAEDASRGERSFGRVGAQMMSLLRKLALVAPLAPEPQSIAFAPTAPGEPELVAPNLIREHRDELRQASTGALDRMVIEVVGALFDQILSDAKVPPQMARQIARLQLPVLRVALGDPTFFSSRRHPVRIFVNRIASLACAFDDFSGDTPGARLLQRVRDLVEEVVRGDFDRVDVYESNLLELEQFVAAQNMQAVQKVAGEAGTAVLDAKESDLRRQQRYALQLQRALAPLLLPEFLRQFLTQVWSQVIVQAARRQPAAPALEATMRRLGRELVLSVQPKGAAAHRKAFLVVLPELMKQLSEGLDLIGWPESAKKPFLGQLMNAHSQALKAGTMSDLDFNLLARNLDAVFSAPLPSSDEAARGQPVPIELPEQIALERQFTAAEATRLGLVAEDVVDWSGKVDVDVQPELVDADLGIEGLPPAETPEPTRGAALIDHLQVGFPYQMHLQDEWRKVRLSHVSPARTFFIFMHGQEHERMISMTARMVARMCESGRLRAFENGYLIERATVRARAQLAKLGLTRPR